MSSAPSPRSASRAACPLCGKTAAPDHSPFCGPGCKDRDLLNWLGDAYRVAGPPVDENMEESGAHGLDRQG